MRTLTPQRWALDHPIRAMVRAGLRVHPNTDDPTLHLVTPTGAWMMMTQFGFDVDDMRQFMLNGLDAAWIADDLRQQWRREWTQTFDTLRQRLVADLYITQRRTAMCAIFLRSTGNLSGIVQALVLL